MSEITIRGGKESIAVVRLLHPFPISTHETDSLLWFHFSLLWPLLWTLTSDWTQDMTRCSSGKTAPPEVFTNSDSPSDPLEVNGRVVFIGGFTRTDSFV